MKKLRDAFDLYDLLVGLIGSITTSLLVTDFSGFPRSVSGASENCHHVV